MMRKLFLYFLSIIAILASCTKEVNDSSVLTIAGMWVELNADMSVAKLIEFKDGAYIEYTPKGGELYFYNKRCIWNCDKSSLRKIVIDEYSISDGKLKRLNVHAPISCNKEILVIGNNKYFYVESVRSDCGFTVSHDIKLDKQNQTICLSSSQEICWNYIFSDLPDIHKLDVKVDADWIQSVIVSRRQIKFQVKENQTSSPRIAKFVLSHPAIDDVIINLQQMVPGQVISSDLTFINYAEEDYEFLYLIENPSVNSIVNVSCSASWITDVKVNEGKISFKVLENNSGASRSASIVLTCAGISATHRVEQSYSPLLLNL